MVETAQAPPWRSSHFRVAAGEQWEIARQRRVGWWFARVRRFRNVFWATGRVLAGVQVSWGFLMNGRGHLHAQPTHRKKTTSTGPLPHTLFPPPSRGANSPAFGSCPTGMGGGGGASHGWTVTGRALTDIQAGQVESSLELGRSSLGLGALGVQEENAKASREMPAFLRASFVARLENILRIGCWLCLVGVDGGYQGPVRFTG